MRKEYGLALRELFAGAMQRRLPDWRPLPAPRPWYWPGERLFVDQRDPAGWRVVVLQPDLKDHEAFDLGIGWSRLHRVPELSMRPSMESPRSSAARAREEFLGVLSDLVPGRADAMTRGWVIDTRSYSLDAAQILAALTERQVRIGAAQARALLAPFVEDAIDGLCRYGLPYLDECLSPP